MASQPEVNILTKDERKHLLRGLDMLIASNGRTNSRESNAAIHELREKENQTLVIIKNKLMSQQLNLQ